MEILALAAFLGVIPAVIAGNKGHNAFLWWIFGAALFIVALPCALLLKPTAAHLQALTGPQKKCPQCAEMIRIEALKCRFCGADVSAVTTAANPFAHLPSYQAGAKSMNDRPPAL